MSPDRRILLPFLAALALAGTARLIGRARPAPPPPEPEVNPAPPLWIAQVQEAGDPGSTPERLARLLATAQGPGQLGHVREALLRALARNPSSPPEVRAAANALLRRAPEPEGVGSPTGWPE